MKRQETIVLKNVDPFVKKNLRMLAKLNHYSSLSPFLKDQLYLVSERKLIDYLDSEFSMALSEIKEEVKYIRQSVHSQELNRLKMIAQAKELSKNLYLMMELLVSDLEL